MIEDEKTDRQEVIDDFSRRMKRQIIAMILAIGMATLMTVTLLAVGVGTTFFVIAGVSFAVIAGVSVFLLINRQCPACGVYLGRSGSFGALFPTFCPRCGVKLRKKG